MTLPDPARLFFVCGPTASGKSARALDLARELDGEIVNADAFQLYRKVEVLTAAPPAEDRKQVSHHLYGVLDPIQPIDAMGYLRLVIPKITEIVDRGKTPILVGGSGLYLKFLSHGPSPLPPGDPILRAELDALPLSTLVDRLREIDPVEAARTALANRRYVSRALEVCLLAGVPCSSLRDDWEQATQTRSASLRGIVLSPPRGELHQRISQRTRAMLDGGAIEEVASLGETAPGLEKAIGLREIRRHLAGEISRDDCADLIDAATRQYAKRQESWFRREHWLQPA
ncbi:MAG: tRNA (adenosine(37)-N6)-dimethylallyltransferase MiaA [Verrucomicrobia bacterium]|nr:MAG: tRNA (adenosine(37)-N6)-dimethylallyltransferase MiaA [Verrucomicrobiota bacterium]TAE85688.1 MAG: tRNA (adenosine(37)-N6)-dimethylallyltransferase MiaA [Verrucomicrobiota bacterium]TAF23082.1 MAG: tRNA (adenosine(37)-N6)-dimethylallyltransferase MiaA [Verrucomicrobiota bacterium]